MKETNRLSAQARHSREGGTSTKRAGLPKAGAKLTSAGINPAPCDIENDWKAREFVRALSTEKPLRRGKLQARNYQSAGKFPVIDQGQSEVAGWTDDESLVIDTGLPYVVFGDHTRNFKYVDQPFVLGADGTQLLKPSLEYCPRFFYYACLHLDLPSRGYNRHYTVLKEQSLPLPCRPEQEKIAAILWKLQRAIATQSRLIAATRDLKHSAMQHFFTHGLCGEPLMDTEIGPMPGGWHASTLGELCAKNGGSIQTGPFGSQLHAREYQAQGTPVVNPTHLLGNKINREAVPKITADRAADLVRHSLRAGDVLFARRGQIGRHGFVSTEEENWICGTGCFLVRVRHPQIVNEFLPCYFSVPGVVAWLEANAAGAIMPNLNNTVLGQLPIYYPVSKSDQRDIATYFATLNRKIAHHQRKQASLDDLFQSILQQLMTAQIRVADLDIDTSEVADHVPDAGKMIGDNAEPVIPDHFVDANKMIQRKSLKRHR